MKNKIEKIFPMNELIAEDEIGLQYMISFDNRRFWLAVPADRDLNDLHFVFVFSGRGGTGRNNALTSGNIPGDFFKMMLKDGFAFICGECSPDAWADPESTAITFEAWEYCRKQGLNMPDKIDLIGGSMGGLGSLIFAARKVGMVRKIVDIFGITDLDDFYNKGNYREALGQLSAAERQDRSPCRKLDCYKDIDFLIIHGTEDTIVDISYSERFYALLKERNYSCKYIVVPGIGHDNNILGKVDKEIHDFLAE